MDVATSENSYNMMLVDYDKFKKAEAQQQTADLQSLLSKATIKTGKTGICFCSTLAILQ